MRNVYFWAFNLLLIISIFGFVYLLNLNIDKDSEIRPILQPAFTLGEVQKNAETPPQCTCPYVVGDKIQERDDEDYYEIVTEIRYYDCPGKGAGTLECRLDKCGYSSRVYNNGEPRGILTGVWVWCE